MRSFKDPVRNEEWRVLVEMDASGALHVVFERDAVRLHPRQELIHNVHELTEGDCARLFTTCHREVCCENDVWHVRWEDQSDQECWTLFESKSARRRLRAQYQFPYVSGRELCDSLRQAELVSAEEVAAGKHWVERELSRLATELGIAEVLEVEWRRTAAGLSRRYWSFVAHVADGDIRGRITGRELEDHDAPEISFRLRNQLRSLLLKHQEREK
jgi:hypothetical protein